MAKLIHDIDRLLRGEFTRDEDLRAGRITLPVKTLVIAGLLLGMFYGGFMGLFAGLRAENHDWRQTVATALKLPLLFLLTLAVTYPSLYVNAALARSRLGAAATLRLLLIAITVTLAILASLGPVIGFFTLSTESYPFMVLLNVLFFAIAGIVGIGFLRRALNAVFAKPPEAPTRMTAPSKEAIEDSTAPGKRSVRSGRQRTDSAATVFRIWVMLFAVVGAQMGWILRPFIGSPDLPFSLLRERESNFFFSVLEALRQLFST